MCALIYNQSEMPGMYLVINLLCSYQLYDIQALRFPSQLTYLSQNMVNGCCFLREFVYVILLGDEYDVDFLESRDSHDKNMPTIMKLSSVEEGLHFLAKKS